MTDTHDTPAPDCGPGLGRFGGLSGAWTRTEQHGMEVAIVDDALTTDAPPRAVGSSRTYDAASFVGVVQDWQTAGATIWADEHGDNITAILNDHAGADRPGWGDHRVDLVLRVSDAWNEWASYDGTLMPQADFAEFLEDHYLDLVDPTAAEMLELAGSFTATRNVRFSAGHRTASGVTTFSYDSDEITRAGKHGAMDVPTEFTLALQPYEAGDAFKIRARLRYRLAENKLRLGYRLLRPAAAKHEAFTSITQDIAEQLQTVIWQGVPVSRPHQIDLVKIRVEK